MIRTTLAATAAVVTAFALAVPAHAADWSYGARGPYTVNQPLNSYSWAGPYLGGNLGYNWGSVSNNPTRPSGFMGGVQIGYNVQSGPLVIGLEGDLQLNGAENRFAGWKFDQHEHVHVAWTDRIDLSTVRPGGLEAFEAMAFGEHRWWGLDDLLASDDPVLPRRLREFLPDLVAGKLPGTPLDITHVDPDLDF